MDNGTAKGRHGKESFDHICKVMLIGDSSVGKTCLLVRFKDGAFLACSYISTVGIDFRSKIVNLDGTKVKLQIFDTAGQERFRSLTHSYYRDAHALLLVYDVTCNESFLNVREWLTVVEEHASPDVIVMILGNKADMNGERVVKTEQGERLAKEYGVAFLETSAKTGLNVDLAFMAIAKDIKAKRSLRSADKDFNMGEFIESKKQSSSCC
ncbi:hypothetical protein ACHWQZ_G013677 [Mnemiopsis leidyi]